MIARACPRCGDPAFEDTLADGTRGIRCSSCGCVSTLKSAGKRMKAWLFRRARPLDKR